MNKTAIKNYAIWARTKLIEDIKYKAGLLGISEKEIAAPLAQSTNEVQYFAIGTRNPYAISGVQIAQRASLADAIKRKAQEVDYKTAYNQIVEEVAYTWFNRFIAVRFMEVNEYLPCKIRVLSAVDGRQEPDIVQNPFDAKLDYTPSEENLINEYQLNNEGDKLFNLLFIKVCNDLSKVLPQLFEAEDDYTELLLNISYTDRDGLIYKLVHDIPEEDFNVEMGGQVEIIGWFYQYYNTELNDIVYDGSYAKKKLSKEWIPAATTIYTPDWVVKYMIENSLGRMWVEGHPNDFLKSQWKYYLEEVEQEESVELELAKIREQYAKLQPEDIKVIDPCMGSGHILVYAFELLMQIYTQMGYAEKEAAISILENNLYGLDIDERAFQLAYFAVMMKARQYHKFILKKQVQCHIYPIVESNGVKVEQLQYFGAQLDEFSKNSAMQEMHGLIKDMHDAKEYGSIISVGNYNWDLLKQFVADFDVSSQMDLFATYGIERNQKLLKDLVAVGEKLGQKYEIVVTNPPYLGNSRFDLKLDTYIKNNYFNEKTDLCMVMYKKSLVGFVKSLGLVSFITTSSWMTVSSFLGLRKFLLSNFDIVSLVDFGSELFEGKVGHNLIVSWITRKTHFCGKFLAIKLDEYCYSRRNDKIREFFNSKNWHETCQKGFESIIGEPIAYWASNKTLKSFKDGISLKQLMNPRVGLQTGNNDKFLRYWHECNKTFINFKAYDYKKTINILEKWYPHNKGGAFRRWYGNHFRVINYKNNGQALRETEGASVIPNQLAFKEAITYSRLGSGQISFRLQPSGFLFDSAAVNGYPNGDQKYYILGLLNTKVISKLTKILSPSFNTPPGDISKIPVINADDKVYQVNFLTKTNLDISRHDWDSFETSWDFQKHPLMPQLPISCETIFTDRTNSRGSVSITSIKLQDEYDRVKESWEKNFLQLKANEEELNRIFIGIYGLQGELTPEVEEKDVTVHRIFDSKEDVPESMKGSNYVLTKQDVVKSLLSYAVGCMFGRYSLDVEGLAYAGGEWDASKYARFIPDPDNVIPITDEDYFEDDIVGRFVEWLKVVYGKETLEENLRFVADALGGSGDTPRQRIRNYFLKDFFKDHCKTYQKRPIYWLYDSGKQNGFKALIYMHRYNKDTTGQVRAEYLGRMEGTYESEINRMEDIKNNGKGREVALAAKRIEKLKKQLKECRDYDEYIGHLALAAIDIDLDDGVKVNYVKVQTAKDGKVLPLLAKI